MELDEFASILQDRVLGVAGVASVEAARTRSTVTASSPTVEHFDLEATAPLLLHRDGPAMEVEINIGVQSSLPALVTAAEVASATAEELASRGFDVQRTVIRIVSIGH